MKLSGLGDVGYVDWICVHCGHVRQVWNTQDQHTLVVCGTVEVRMVSCMVSLWTYFCVRQKIADAGRLGRCFDAADFLIIGAVGLLGTTHGNWLSLEIAVELGITLGDGSPLEIDKIWMWILAGRGFWISMLAWTGFLIEVVSEVMKGT